MARFLPPSPNLTLLAALGLAAALPVAAHAEDAPAPSTPAPASTAPATEPAQSEEAKAPAEAATVAATTPSAPAAVSLVAQATNEDLERRVRELEETVRQLREQLQKPTTPPADSKQVEKIVDDRLKAQKPAAGFENGKGFFIQSQDGNFQLRLRMLLQASARAFTSESGRTGFDSFYLRRARPIFEGTVYKNVDFRIVPDFGLGSTALQDGYIELKTFPQALLRMGKFKEPVSLERLQSGSDLLFVERSLTNNLSPNRDVGFQVSGDVLKTRLSYAIGAFNGVADNSSVDADTDNDKDVAARLFAQPFRTKPGHPLEGLGFGIGASYGQREASSSPTYRSAGRTTLFRYGSGVIGTGEQLRLAPQFHYYRGPFGILGEYISSRQDVQRGLRRATVDNRSWFVQASYVLTGERASFRSVVPRNNFDPKNGKWGAFEIAARYSDLSLDDDLFSGGPAARFADPAASITGARAWTLGLNWYLNRNLKLQFNYERTDFDGNGILINGLRRDHEDVFLTQFQVAF
jgi:phosphate-selective porin OprO/OprP